MAKIEAQAYKRIRKYYTNAAKAHPSMADSIESLINVIEQEMSLLDNGIPPKCHIVNPSFLTMWNENGWTDVSSLNTKWHYAYTHDGTQAIIHDAEHSNNMSDSAMRPINEMLQKALSLIERIENL